MTKLCLDTSAYSHFRRGHPDAVALISSARQVFVPAIVLGELRAGFRCGSRPQTNEDELQRFLANPAVSVLPVDDDAASRYADLIVHLRRAATPLPINDVWIAALALSSGSVIVTYDAHFAALPQLGVRILKVAP